MSSNFVLLALPIEDLYDGFPRNSLCGNAGQSGLLPESDVIHNGGNFDVNHDDDVPEWGAFVTQWLETVELLVLVVVGAPDGISCVPSGREEEMVAGFVVAGSLIAMDETVPYDAFPTFTCGRMVKEEGILGRHGGGHAVAAG